MGRFFDNAAARDQFKRQIDLLGDVIRESAYTDNAAFPFFRELMSAYVIYQKSLDSNVWYGLDDLFRLRLREEFSTNLPESTAAQEAIDKLIEIYDAFSKPHLDESAQL